MLSPLAAVVVFPRFPYPTITSKVLLWSVVVEALAVVCGLWIWLAATDRANTRLNLVHWGLLVYVGTLLLTSVMGENVSGSIWGTLERGDGLMFYLHLAAFVYLTTLVLHSAKDYRRLLQSFVGAGGFAVVVAVGQAATMGYRPDMPWVRVDSVFGNANAYGHFLIFSIFFTFVLLGEHIQSVIARHPARGIPWMRLLRTWQPWWYGGMLLWLGYGVALTASRGTSLGLLVGLAVVFGVLVGQQMVRAARRIKILGWSLGVLAAIALVAFALGQSSLKGQLQPFFNYSLDADGTAARRLAIWQAGLDAVSQRRLVGWGWGAFRDVLDRHFPPQVMRDEGSIIIFDRAHNFVVDHLVAGGVMAVGAYLVLHATLMLAWLLAWRRRAWSPLSLASLLGLLVANFTFNLFSFPWVGSYIGWAVLLSVFAHLGVRQSTTANATPKLARGVGVVLIGSGLLAFLGSSLPMGILVGRELPRLRDNPAPAAIVNLVQRYPRFSEDILHLAPEEQGLRAAVERRPQSFQLLKEIFQYYESRGFPLEVRPAVTRYVTMALELAPTHPVSHLMAATFAIAEERYLDAIAHSEDAIALNPSLSLSYWVAADAAGRSNRMELAWEYVQRAQAVELDPNRPGRYLSSYSFRPVRMRAFAGLLVQQGQYQSAADILIEQVGLEEHFRQHDVRYQPGGDLALLVNLVQRVDQAKGLDQARQIARTISEKLPVLAQQLTPYLGERR